MGFVVLGSTESGSTLSTIQNLNDTTTRASYIWELNNDSHTDSAVAHARDVYGFTTTSGTGKPVIPYSGVKAAITDANNVKLNVSGPTQYTTRNPNYFDTVTPAYTTPATMTGKLPIFSLPKGITKVRVYMWIEGQDVDCENNASGGAITYDLEFTTVAD